MKTETEHRKVEATAPPSPAGLWAPSRRPTCERDRDLDELWRWIEEHGFDEEP